MAAIGKDVNKKLTGVEFLFQYFQDNSGVKSKDENCSRITHFYFDI